MSNLEMDLRAVEALADAGDLAAAQNTASGLLREHPNDPRAIAMMAYVLYHMDEHGIGYSLMRRVLEMLPHNATHLNSIGMHALGCMDYAEAEKYLKAALQRDPNEWRAMSNLALTYVHQCQPGLAIEYGKRALKHVPDDDNIKETLGYAYLMMGDWDNGFRHFEHSVGNKVRYVKHKIPYWQGEPCKSLLVQGEQGIGDEINFASVIPSIEGVERVILDCQDRLEGLFRRSFPNVEVHGTRNQKVFHQAEKQCLIGSLCTHYRLKPEDFPGEPFLVADPERRIQWRALLDSLGSKPKVGLAWKGGRPNTRRKFRSLALEQLLPILRQDATFISLEYKSPESEIEALEETHGIKVHHWPRAVQAHDYDETAALVAELDLVISVQTATVHLAGALGKECWAMLPRSPLWRYNLTGDRTVWYRSVRLFRQKSDWAGVINKVAEDLCKSIREYGGPQKP